MKGSMATLQDLKRSITELSEKDALDLIMKIRQARRTYVAKPVKAKKPVIDVDNLTPDMAGALLELLKECTKE